MDSAGKLISENNVPEIYGGSVLKLAGTLYLGPPVDLTASRCNWRHSNRHPGRPCRQLRLNRGGTMADAATIIRRMTIMQESGR